MQNLLHHTISIFMAFFAIMNPIANTPIFIGLTEGDEVPVKRKIASQSLFLAFIIVLISCLAGNLILKTFGITLPAFRITGGILVFIIGLQMLHGNPSGPIEHHRFTPCCSDTRWARNYCYCNEFLRSY